MQSPDEKRLPRDKLSELASEYVCRNDQALLTEAAEVEAGKRRKMSPQAIKRIAGRAGERHELQSGKFLF